MPQTLGFSERREEGSDEDFRPERMTGIFAPPPLFLAFHLNGAWTSIAIGSKARGLSIPCAGVFRLTLCWRIVLCGLHGLSQRRRRLCIAQFLQCICLQPSRYAEAYTAWLTTSGFCHRAAFTKTCVGITCPIFCGWAEQTVESVPLGGAPNKLATQANYEKWIAVLDERGLPFGTIVIDDKWQQGYGTFEVDQQKWPDLKGFIATQHAKGRHVLLWVPVADPDGLPESLCVKDEQRCPIADVGNPEYEAYLRPRIQHLVNDLGVDGFKEDWVKAPAAPGLALTGATTGIEFVRRFQSILYTETHKWKPDALVETQTPNALFRESSDVFRLNDIWYSSRNVPEMMRLRARIANISGWPVVDTDNASSTTSQGLVGLHAGAAHDRHSCSLLRHQHRSHAGKSLA